MNKVKLPGGTENLRKAGLWMLGNMEYNVPLSAIAAINEMRNAAAMIRGRQDLYHHTLKHNLNEALRQADNKRTLYLSIYKDRKAFDEYMDNIVDITEADVTRLRELLAADLQRRGVPDAELVAWVEEANMLLHLAVRHYENVVSRGNDKANADIAVRHVLIDYHRHFAHYRPSDLADAWNIVATQMNPAVLAVTEGEVLDQLRLIASKYEDGTYINRCIDLMRHHPMFADLKAEPDGGGK